MEQIKTRSEIEAKYKWDLKAIYSSETEVLNALNEIEEQTKELVSYKGKIMQDSDTLYAFYELHDQLSRLLEKVGIYVLLYLDEDTTNSDAQALKMKVMHLLERVGEETSFIGPEMLKTPYAVVEQYLKENPKLELYRFDLEKVYRFQKYTLTEREEEIIAMASNALDTPDEVFTHLDNADVHYGKIRNEENQEVELTNENYSVYIESKNREVRKNAFETLYHYWEGIKNTVSATLKGQIKATLFQSKVHHYDSSLEASLYDDNINLSVYHNLIDTVHKNLDKMYDFMEFKKHMLGLDELHMYDIHVDLTNEESKTYSYEETKEIILEALKPLGEQYVTDLKKGLESGWVDVYPTQNKKSGAYCTASYETHPYVLLNYYGNIGSVSTAAHELGHAMHYYYSIKNQPSVYYSYPIFSAEIASTVNEVLLNEYMYQHAESKNEKIIILTKFLSNVRATIYRQTMFAEFEMLMHEKEANGVPLTEKEFSNTYYALNRLYYGDGVVSDDLIRYEWERIPHFYTPFYVYKYATGLSAALAIASKILAGDTKTRDKYLQFLSSGDSNYPLELLKEVGVDMTTPTPIEEALHLFDVKLQELKELCGY